MPLQRAMERSGSTIVVRRSKGDDIRKESSGGGGESLDTLDITRGSQTT